VGYAIIRQSEPLESLPLQHVGFGPQRNDDIYVLVEDGVARWQVGVGWGEASSTPFREEVSWPSADAVVIGGGSDVYFFDLRTGEIRLRAPVRTYFGHLALHTAPDTDLLFVLGCSDVFAYRPSLTLQWRAENIAVDGITFDGVDGSLVRVNAEMDPPGGWFAVDLTPRIT
jgi:hypothetical protein